ncbi:hypothetical protein KGQ34_01075 [Patescibacteria group bacterium]|nr:hypothetical protein [Patescibacteria group bacterium]
MKISYRSATILFFVFYLLPIVGMGYLVYQRIEQRQVALQLFLQNQVDVDRQIIVERERLRNIQPRIHSFLLKSGNADNDATALIGSVKDDAEKIKKFWERYDADYSASNRPFLRNILKENQETNLIDEEQDVVSAIQKNANLYFDSIFSSSLFVKADLAQASPRDIEMFLSALDAKRDSIFASINQLADIRYIYSQRSVFFINGENDKQQGFFNAIFISLFFIIFILHLLESFFIHKPFKDIMFFLKDMSEGKRGQRLYFSSPIREVKKTEEVINEFVDKAEQYEKEK